MGDKGACEGPRLGRIEGFSGKEWVIRLEREVWAASWKRLDAEELQALSSRRVGQEAGTGWHGERGSTGREVLGRFSNSSPGN